MKWILAFLITLPVLAEEKKPIRGPASIEKEEPGLHKEKKKDIRYKDHLFNQVQETLVNLIEEER